MERAAKFMPWMADAGAAPVESIQRFASHPLAPPLFLEQSPPALSLLAGFAPANSGSCSLDTIQQEMERLPEGTRRLAVQLRDGLDPGWFWSVLTDYANLSRFIPNLAASRLIWRRGSTVCLEQVGSQQFCGLRFTAKVELELSEHPEAAVSGGQLRFTMRRGDFRRFEGAWVIAPEPVAGGLGTRLLYDLTVQGRPGMPIGLIEQRLRDDLAANLRAVQQEAQRRAAL